LAYRLIPLNSTTVGFAYLLFVLIVASTWGFLEASVASLFAALLFNFFFFEPIGTLVIDDPQNWAAVFSLFGTALIGSRLSAIAKRRALDAMERQQDLERLYTFSRAILLIDATEPFPKQLARKLADVFDLSAVLLYDRRCDEVYRAGPSDFEGMEDQLREAALQGTSFTDTKRNRVITAVRLGAEPIASLALQGEPMPDSVLQGIANLIAIGLERARAQELGHEIEAARQTERLRTTLIDAMAHELKTPLTSIKAATTSLLANPELPVSTRVELLKIADEEADRLKEQIDDTIEMARLDAADIDVQAEASDLREIATGVVAAMQTVIDNRPMEVIGESNAPVPLDRRLVKLALRQLLDNALKYSPPGKPVTLSVGGAPGEVYLEITDHGSGIPAQEQARIFQRFYRSPSTQNAIPGSGLGLSIARRIVQAHHGDLTVRSRPGETTFRMTFPKIADGDPS
jgi:two-component system sensor histidine kinase KdpD